MTIPIVLLHGANGSSLAIAPLAEALREQWPTIALPNLLGHGGRPVPPALSVEAMAADLARLLDDNGIAQAILVGYSFGGYLALYCAKHFPERVAAVCTLATRHVMDEATIDRWVDLTTASRLVARAPNRRFELVREHAPQDWRLVLERNREMFEAMRGKLPLTPGDLQAIRQPVLVVSGSEDQLVSAQDTADLGRAVRATTLLFPGRAHPIMSVPLETVARGIGDWLRRQPGLSG